MKLGKKCLGASIALICTALLSCHVEAKSASMMRDEQKPSESSSTKATTTTKANTNHEEQQKQVEALVKSAADYIKKNGKEKAIEEFNKKQGAFTKGNSYVFVIDNQGVRLADSNNPDLVNKGKQDVLDENGNVLLQIEDLINLANMGGGWILYRSKEPMTQVVGCKKSYVIPMEGGYFIGSGFYYAAGPDGKCGS